MKSEAVSALAGVFVGAVVGFGTTYMTTKVALHTVTIEERTAILNAFGSGLSSTDPRNRAIALRALHGTHPKAAVAYAWSLLCFHTGDQGIERMYIDREIQFAVHVIDIQEKLHVSWPKGEVFSIGGVAVDEAQGKRRSKEGYVTSLKDECERRGHATFRHSFITPNFESPEKPIETPSSPEK